MANDRLKINHSYEGEICRIQLVLPKKLDYNVGYDELGSGKNFVNERNCDIFVDDNNLLVYADVLLYKFHSTRQFNIKDLKTLVIKFDAQQRCFELQLPCLTQGDEENLEPHLENMESLYSVAQKERPLDLWKLKRITDLCQLQLNNSTELLKFEANFHYGFTCKYVGKLKLGDSCSSAISYMPQPHLKSPVQRAIDREIDEMKDFSAEQYKLNFVELQVPEGHDNPMKTSIYFDYQLTTEEQNLLHNLTRVLEDCKLPEEYDQAEMDYGLINIMLAICYDLRCTSNEPTCESAWTRSILSATLTYFQPFTSLKEVVISFLRRTLIYPLYRNYDLARLCVEDVVEVLQRSHMWMVKQLLITHQLFASSECNREVLNTYYINDYIRYTETLPFRIGVNVKLLAFNLKNILLCISKKQLRLGLGEIETELLRELISDIHVIPESGETEEESDDDDEDENAEHDAHDTETSSASETEEDSVIEQHMNASPL